MNGRENHCNFNGLINVFINGVYTNFIIDYIPLVRHINAYWMYEKKLPFHM